MKRFRALSSEAGVTLVEVLVTITILSIAVVTIVAALGSTAISSDRHRKQVNVDAVVRNYGDALGQYTRTGGYVPCATSYPTLPAGWLPAGYSAYTVSTSVIAYAQPDGSFAATCPGTGDFGLQQVRVTARSIDGRAIDNFVVIVRQA